jgi:hypothetical protein
VLHCFFYRFFTNLQISCLFPCGFFPLLSSYSFNFLLRLFYVVYSILTVKGQSHQIRFA